MKTMCPPGYHHNGFVATHALGHITYGYTLMVPMNQRVLNKQSKEHNISGHIYMYMYIYMINLFNFGIKTVVHIIIKYDQLKPKNNNNT